MPGLVLLMRSLWFIVPAHGRLDVSRICLTQLRRTCDELTANGVRASAVIVSDDENLDTARALDFTTYERNNWFTSMRFNDGIQAACDPEFNPYPADYVVPLGSDDWVDWRLFVNLPPPNTMVGFQRMSFVREDGRELSVRHINSEGGCGIRIWPRAILARMRYRPADEDRRRGCDTSMLVNTRREVNLRVVHRDLDPLQIVDWKSPGENLNPYDSLGRHRQELTRDPFEVLAGRYPADALSDMRDLYYSRVLVAA